MTSKHEHRLVKLAMLVVVSNGAILRAGDLVPPPGPVGPTMKPLSQIEPRIPISAATTPGDGTCVFKITQDGTYYLTGNVYVPIGKNGILFSGAGGVTVDLNGFNITGQAGSLSGITANAANAGPLCIRNGAIRFMGSHGIDVYNTTSGRIEGVLVTGNGGSGMRPGFDMTVSDCVAESNTGSGFALDHATVAHRCVASLNGAGFTTTTGVVTLDLCEATNNYGHGFNLPGGGVLHACTSTNNNDVGFRFGAGSMLSHCAGSYNETGFVAINDAQVESCVALFNSTVGFELGANSTVHGCLANGNGLQGIRLGGDFCTATGNQCRNNGSCCAGLWVAANACHVEDNQATGNGYGFYVSGTDNIVARNSARANGSGNYYVTGTNEVAPVVTNPGSNNFTTATPWSNFAY